jgi:selenocysteine lyase/cysteine desulfurase
LNYFLFVSKLPLPVIKYEGSQQKICHVTCLKGDRALHKRIIQRGAHIQLQGARMGEKRIIYMDHAATTNTKKEVVDAMIPYFTDHFGNPSSLYGIARESKKALDAARAQVAKALGADPDEIYFTSGGSEPDNPAIKGVAWANIDPVRRCRLMKVR